MGRKRAAVPALGGAMISFPLFDQLDITGYGMFPGAKGGEPGLHIEFQPGLTYILGANGLGKTTLTTILYRMLTGPTDIPGLAGRADLGSANLMPTKLRGSAKATFANRVFDGARNAKARLKFTLGENDIVVERRLSDLSLLRFEVDGQERSTDETESFQAEIAHLVGVWSFGDWILLLRHIVFYFEDRRALIWDPSAQRQLLRFLFLPPETARKWTEDERVILEMDSRSRNLHAVVYREAKALSETELKVKTLGDVREELRVLEELQAVDIEQREELDDSFVEIEARRQAARLRHLKAEQERETRYREMERAKLTAVEARFPKHSDTARYILGQLFTEAECLVCGNHVPDARADLEIRIEHDRCVVCGTELGKPEAHVPAAKVADRRVKKAVAALETIESDQTEARRQLDDLEAEYASFVQEVAQLNASIAERSARIDHLVRRLPPDEAEVHKQRSELAAWRSRVETLRSDLIEKRQEFRAFVDEESRTMVAQSGDIKVSFEHHAKGFLLEQCDLVWSPRKARVGQTGEFIEYPAFELDMTGTNFPSPVRRTDPEQVSESQREFIDLAFRMSLMEVAGTGSVGSLVIDAPESSLDAVFVTRAADVLARFAKPKWGNRLVITSNLIEGNLIPELLKRSSTRGSRRSRLVDLFTIAEPTAAVRKLRSQYQKIMDDLLARVGVKTPSKPKTPRKRPSRKAARSKRRS